MQKSAIDFVTRKFSRDCVIELSRGGCKISLYFLGISDLTAGAWSIFYEVPGQYREKICVCIIVCMHHDPNWGHAGKACG